MERMANRCQPQENQRIIPKYTVANVATVATVGALHLDMHCAERVYLPLCLSVLLCTCVHLSAHRKVCTCPAVYSHHLMSHSLSHCLVLLHLALCLSSSPLKKEQRVPAVLQIVLCSRPLRSPICWVSQILLHHDKKSTSCWALSKRWRSCQLKAVHLFSAGLLKSA